MRKQGVEIAAHNGQVGAAVNLRSPVVAGQALVAEVARREIAHFHLTDAEGADLAQIFFEHEPVRHDFARVDCVEPLLQFSRVACHRLAVAAGGEHLLDANRPTFEQPMTG